MGDIDLGTSTAAATSTAGQDSAATGGESVTSSAFSPVAADTTAAPAVANSATAQPPAPTPEPRANLTARLAALSRENRETAKRASAAERAVAAAEARATEAAAKAADMETLFAKAKDDPSVIPDLFKRAGLSFEKVVNFYAESGNEPTPEAAQAKAIEELRRELDADKAARAAEALASRNAAIQRQAESARAETIGSIAQTIAKQATKYEICARLGAEAASDVFTEVVSAWEKAGRPELMPGEFEEAVEAAAELTELRYEERGKKLAKAQKTPAPVAPTPTKTSNLAPKGTELPDGLTPSRLSDKDEDILKGLTDKTAPSYDSQRARPRTINSSLGGSAPPKAPARGTMDPRDALREVLQPFQRA